MNKYLPFGLFLVIFFFNSCKEVYHPKLDEAEKMLVVEGILTDESNVITVRLGNAVPFRDQAYLPEQNATLIVFDDLGREFIFQEEDPGIYESKSFQYEYGRTYTLLIKTSKNKYYRSSPQTLFPKTNLDTITAIVTTKTLQTTKNGELILKTLPGIEFFTIINDKASPSYYRFSNTVLVEYKEKQDYIEMPYDTLPQLFNCWKKYFPNQFFNLSEPFNNLDKHIQTLSFCPLDSGYFSIVQELYIRFPESDIQYWRSLYYFGITIKQVRLNFDVYQYYKDINRQLEANNRIFDPVSFQTRGNITCDIDPEEPVLGVFEAVSTSIRSYSFSDFQLDKSVKFKEIKPLNMENIPYEGKCYNYYPSFWIFDY
jgi:hypothetical protein